MMIQQKKTMIGNACATVLLGLLVGLGGTVRAGERMLPASADAIAIGADPAGNYGTLSFARIRHQASADWGNYHPLVKFDLSALPGNAKIISVRMRFYVGLSDDGGAGWPSADDFPVVAIFNNTSAWDESTVTYNTRPSHDSSAVETRDHFGSIGVDEVYFTAPNTISSGGWLEYTGTGTKNLVQGWADGTITNYGVTIKGTGAYTDSSRYFDLQTKVLRRFLW